jgi:hypothetical protein
VSRQRGRVGNEGANDRRELDEPALRALIAYLQRQLDG